MIRKGIILAGEKGTLHLKFHAFGLQLGFDEVSSSTYRTGVA